MDKKSRLLKWVANSTLPCFLRRSCARKFKRRNTGKSLEVKTKDGCILKVIIGDGVDNEIALRGEFEPHISAVIRGIIRGAGGHFLDIGCHLGYYSTMVTASVPGIKLTAVDANPVMAARCRENLALNGLHGDVVNVGVGAEHAVLNFNTSKKMPSLGTFGDNPPAELEIETISVKVVPFSEIVEQTEGPILLIKMDVEGFEFLALSTLRDDQVSRIENMIIEFSEERLQQCGQTRRAFEGLPWLAKYELTMVAENGELVSIQSLSEVPGGDQNIWLHRKQV